MLYASYLRGEIMKKTVDVKEVNKVNHKWYHGFTKNFEIETTRYPACYFHDDDQTVVVFRCDCGYEKSTRTSIEREL